MPQSYINHQARVVLIKVNSLFMNMKSDCIPLTTQGSKLKKMFGRKFATSYENLVATLKMLVAKLIEAI